MHVPFIDLNAQHAPLRAEIASAIQQVIDQSAFAGGPFVAAFEKEFAAYCGTRHAVALGNGTDALRLALQSLGVGPGDEVITVPNSFMATAEAISHCGAKPVFVDIDEETYTMDPSELEPAITKHTKAIIPVHLYGQCADMDPILEIAGSWGIPVLEDACQAHGAEYKGRRAGSLGCMGCFSFYPGKNLGALGEGGAVTTNDTELARRICMLRDHGQERKYDHALVGWNARMDGIQGAVLSIKLRHLDKGNAARQAHARLYEKLLSPIPGIIHPRTAAHNRHAFHLYVIRVSRRDELLRALGDNGIHCGIHYPIPIHLQRAYSELGLTEGSYPVTERCAKQLLSLPMFPDLTVEQIEATAGALGAELSAELLHAS